ncbi:LysM peptidoglycan-binding domain-containing protein [Aurantimonas sp. HBX-1]|uniref:LysM peptidoglycan-binding domain-containing protein n=1 Tax=Aurantimonas sp. HBX-1 TaxID=2906072 RepID=UPI001F1BCB09|nr:LysM peptidoglycan-binding domain-containing protein [Aurantimonas sp. HBX-1]UIJ70317.1 LysM peptidoglycan-binding domain-containing protein [Aurantimonas sp. HBX-1]
MQRKVVGILLVCVVLLVAIVAGYWDMLQSERLRISNRPQEAAETDVAALPPVPAADVPAAGPGETAGPSGSDANRQAPGAAGEALPDEAAPEGSSASPTTPSPTGESTAAVVEAPQERPADTGNLAESAGQGAAAVAPAPAPAPGAAGPAESAPQPTVPDAERRAAVETSTATGPEDIAADAGDAAAPAAAEPDAGADATGPLPRFDLLRVEPDGATVIAGRAAPGSRISLTDGDATVGTDTASAAGEFAIALEKPLGPGDHAIRIVATAEDGAVATSEETAIVSVPEPGRESELLAMVEAPNQASRLISVPAGQPQETAPAVVPPRSAAPSDTTQAPGAAAGNEPGLAGTGADTSAPAELAAAAPPSRTGQSEPEPAPAVPVLRVEAVEIESGKLYVAGAARPGAQVRVYIDNVLIAEDRASREGRFLVSADAPVAPGDHLVRADQLAPRGGVEMRAEVPFQRPEGTSVAMVAPLPAGSDGPAGDDAADRTGDDGTPAGRAGADSTASASPSPPDAGTTPRAPTDVPDAAAVADAATPRDAPAISAGGDAAADRTAEAAAVADRSTGEASRADAGTLAPAVPATADEQAAPEPDAPGAASPEDLVPVTRQEALTTAPGRVIIRRGDSLWRISRETYGLGSRYVVIYLANGDQIRNPHLIYPGQVFSVPVERTDAPPQGGSG